MEKKLSAMLIVLMMGLFAPCFATDIDDAINFYQTGEFKKVLKVIEKIENKGQMNAKVALLKYEAYKGLNKYKEAKDALNLALRFDPSCYEAYIALAILSIEDSNPKLAKNYFRQAIEIYPKLADSAGILYYYTKLCILNNDMDGALKNILSAIEINGDDELYYLELGKIYLYKKDYLRAINAFEYINTNDYKIKAEVFNYLGMAYYKRGNLKISLNYFKKAINLESDNVIYLSNLAMNYKSLGDMNQYNLLTNKVSYMTPKTPIEYLQISQIFHSRNNLVGAKSILQKGLENYPNNLLLKEAVLKLNKS